MNAGIIASKTEKAISSIELVEIINAMREEGKATLRHDTFLRKIEKVIGPTHQNFVASYKDATGRAPKVAFAETIRAIDGVCHIEKIAKTLGFGRNKFFKQLREDSILMGNNLPYQKYIDREYFTVVEQEPYTDKEGVKHPTFTAMVTGAGQVFLARKYTDAGRLAA